MRLRNVRSPPLGGDRRGRPLVLMGSFPGLRQLAVPASRRWWTVQPYAAIQRCGSDQPTNAGVELRALK